MASPLASGGGRRRHVPDLLLRGRRRDRLGRDGPHPHRAVQPRGGRHGSLLPLAGGGGRNHRPVRIGDRRVGQARDCEPEGAVAEVEIGIYKSGRQAYGFDDIAIVPSRRTRDPEDVDISWQLDAFRFELPLLGAAMDGVVSPATAIELGRLGGAGVLNLEGLWTRYEDPTPLFDEIRELDDDKATPRMQQMCHPPGPCIQA